MGRILKTLLIGGLLLFFVFLFRVPLPISKEEGSRAKSSGLKGSGNSQSIPRQPPQKSETQSDRFSQDPILSSKETSPDSEGKFERIKVVQSKFKYPFIRILETVARDSKSGTEKVIQRKSMVAD